LEIVRHATAQASSALSSEKGLDSDEDPGGTMEMAVAELFHIMRGELRRGTITDGIP